MQHYDEPGFVNIGTGTDLSIRELAELIKGIVGYEGELVWNTDKPDGTPRKLMDVSRLHGLGWHHRIELPAGIRQVYGRFKQQQDIRVY